MRLLNRILFLSLLILLSHLPAVAGQEIGGISEVIGGVDILKDGKLPAEPAKVGDRVFQGDVIRTKTGGKAQIKFRDDSIITVAPDSRVALNEYVYEPGKNQREALIKVFYGLVHAVVNKMFNNEKPDFTVETQTAIIGVRGTDFYTVVAPVVTDVYNNSGITEVRNVFSEIAGSVKLKGREYTQVSKNLSPTLPLPLTLEDIKWLEKQMNPKRDDNTSGSGAFPGQTDLLGQVGKRALETQNFTGPPKLPLNQPNAIQNLQSPMYVPPQPVVATIPAPTRSSTPVSPVSPVSPISPLGR